MYWDHRRTPFLASHWGASVLYVLRISIFKLHPNAVCSQHRTVFSYLAHIHTTYSKRGGEMKAVANVILKGLPQSFCVFGGWVHCQREREEKQLKVLSQLPEVLLFSVFSLIRHMCEPCPHYVLVKMDKCIQPNVELDKRMWDILV